MFKITIISDKPLVYGGNYDKDDPSLTSDLVHLIESTLKASTSFNLKYFDKIQVEHNGDVVSVEKLGADYDKTTEKEV